jgi:hypothetical protein
MTFLAWVDYSNMMLCVFTNDTGFICEKYIGGSKVYGAIKECSNADELEEFLLSFHNAPEKYIKELLSKIESKNT